MNRETAIEKLIDLIVDDAEFNHTETGVRFTDSNLSWNFLGLNDDSIVYEDEEFLLTDLEQSKLQNITISRKDIP